ncbi:hypothetical protein [Xanthobacter versatilis]|uniref:hypothetical protein n=1 Tax=Xanthobacter autotrophicus (strain ATCC BAA-1158 / Py2) TaxID=78245 RepID=UPI003729B6BD
MERDLQAGQTGGIAIVEAAATENGRHGWCALVLTPTGTRFATGHLPNGTKGQAVYVALAEALRLLPSDGTAHVVLPNVDHAPFDLVAVTARAMHRRPGASECYPDAHHLGDAACFVTVARNLAEAEALRTQGAA